MCRFDVKKLKALIFLLGIVLFGAINIFASTISVKEKQLRYQEVFYHFYRKDAFNAIVNLSTGMFQGDFPEKLNRNQLLLGSMYFTYDLNEMAESIFLKVTRSKADSQQRSMAWYYLAKIYYKNNNFSLLNSALENSKSDLPASLMAERAYLLGMYYLKLKDFKKAEGALKIIDDDTFWYQMFKFNLGASYIKINMGEKGEDFIRDVGESRHENEHMLALKDKSNIVLGYYYLRNKNSREAIGVLENVRLAGPFSNKALLGLGWAYTEKNQFRKALIPWMALAEKDPAQVTVQEAQLAVPFAFTQLKAENESLALYKKSIKSYEAVKTEIDLSLGIVKSSSIFNILLGDRSYDDYTISRKIIEHKDSIQGRVLTELLKKGEFQYIFSTYRDLKQLESKLKTWRDELTKMSILLKSLPKDARFENSYKPKSHPFVKDKRYYVEAVLTLSDRVKLQSDHMDVLMGMYESFVKHHVVTALNKNRQYIVTYLSQTRFALAEMLDKAQRLE